MAQHCGLSAQHNGFQTGSAHFVDRVGIVAFRDPCIKVILMFYKVKNQPDFNAICLETFCPTPAVNTEPVIVSSI